MLFLRKDINDFAMLNSKNRKKSAWCLKTLKKFFDM